MDKEARKRLEAAKRGAIFQRLVRCARLVNEAAIERFREAPGFDFARIRHLAIMPHLDLEGTRLTELARRMDVTKQAAGQLVDELETLGVVTRSPDPSDRRAKLVMFTELGHETIKVGLGVLQDFAAELEETFPSGAWKALDEGLTHLERVLEAQEDGVRTKAR